MDPAFILNLLGGMAFLYVLAALVPLVFNKHELAGNLAGNLLAAAASAFGVALAILVLVYGLHAAGQTIEFSISTALPQIQLTVRLDLLSAFFILALSLLGLAVSVYAIGYTRHYLGRKPIWLLNMLTPLFTCSMAGVFVAGDAVSFLIAWELMALTSYGLVMFEHESGETQRAGTRYIIMTHAGTAFLFAAFFMLYTQTGSFDFAVWAQAGLAGGIQSASLLFVLLLIGFGTKAGIVPLHIWLPAAHPAAPGHISALMSGIMVKTAIYGLIRFLFDIIGIRQAWWGLLLLLLGAVSAVIGIAYGYVESNMKRLLAYSSIENIGVIFMGAGLAALAAAGGRSELLLFALVATLLHTFNHALFKGLMFLGAGSVHYACHTKNIEVLGGLIKRMPWTGLFTLCGSLALSAIIPLNGFIGEWFLYQSFFQNILREAPLNRLILMLGVAALAFAGALAAGTFVKLIGIAFLGRGRSPAALEAREVPLPMLLGQGLLAGLCLLIGLFPLPLVAMTQNTLPGLASLSALGSFVPLIDRLQGFSSFLILPLEAENGSVLPAGALLGMLLAVGLALLVGRLFGGKQKTRIFETWACGFKALSSRMQYSARGFANPVKIIMKALYRPRARITAENAGQPYNPGAMHYELNTEKIIEKHLYGPPVRAIRWLAAWIQERLHTGSVHMYLIYIFLAVVLLLIYTRLCG